AHGFSKDHRLPTIPDRITVPAQKKIQTMYSAGLRKAVDEPKNPLTIVAASAATPATPPITRGQGERPSGSSHRASRRGYATAFSPTCSPVNTTTRTKDSNTTPPAANK